MQVGAPPAPFPARVYVDEMASDLKSQKTGSKDPDGRVFVVDAQGRRPFMRGIMVHSLTARGIEFERAYEIAEKVRQAIRGRSEVGREELAVLRGRLSSGVASPAEGAEESLALPAVVEVGGGRRSVPFSKEVLSQSLLAASIDPTDAFEVAREIELRLHRDGTREVPRKELRLIAHEVLLGRFGEATADRFLTWREYQEPTKPVIILLGGTTGVGKTSIALEVALRLGIRRVLSTDSIRQVMRLMLSNELAPALHASSFDAHAALGLDGEGASRVFEGFLQQTTIVSLGVRAILERAIEEHTSLVLDGVSIVPGQTDLDGYRSKAHVIPLMIGRLDEQAFLGHFRQRGTEAPRRGMTRYLQNIDSIVAIQNQLLELADEHDVPIVDNRSVESSVPLVIRHVVEFLRNSGGPPEPELPYDESEGR